MIVQCIALALSRYMYRCSIFELYSSIKLNQYIRVCIETFLGPDKLLFFSKCAYINPPKS